MSTTGSHWRKPSITTRGRRSYRTISWRIIITELPSPACRPKTRSGPRRGSGASRTTILRPSRDFAAHESTRSQPRSAA